MSVTLQSLDGSCLLRRKKGPKRNAHRLVGSLSAAPRRPGQVVAPSNTSGRGVRRWSMTSATCAVVLGVGAMPGYGRRSARVGTRVRVRVDLFFGGQNGALDDLYSTRQYSTKLESSVCATQTGSNVNMFRGEQLSNKLVAHKNARCLLQATFKSQST